MQGMNEDSGSLGFKLISVSIGLTLVAAIIVGVVVTKMSEDTVKERLSRDAERVAEVAVAAWGDPASAGQAVSRELLALKLDRAGSAWIVDSAGKVVAVADPRVAVGDSKFAEAEIELTSVSQPLAQIGEKKVGAKMPINEIVGLYQSGFGKITLDKYSGENKLVAFVTVPEKGWMVAVDEPLGQAQSASSNLKRYVLITCLVLGLGVIVSTAVSISFIIKPFYRSQMELSQRIASANRNLKRLHEVSIGMQKHLNLDQRIQDILKAAREVVGLDRIFIFMPEAEAKFLQCRGAVGNEDEPAEELRIPISPEGGALARAYTYRENLRITGGDIPENLRLSPPYSELKALRSREFVVIPLIVEDTCVGVVAADNQLSKIPITKEKIAGIELFINQAAIAIQNANMYEKLRLHADYLQVTDHLTHTYTFEHFKYLLGNMMEEAKSGDGGLTLAILTVGNFGSYNRLSGHKNGDTVLSIMSQIIKGRVGPDDIVGRCFGSTFGLIFPCSCEEDARKTLGNIIADLAKTEFPKEYLLEEKKLSFLSAVLAYKKDNFHSVDEYMSHTIEKARSHII